MARGRDGAVDATPGPALPAADVGTAPARSFYYHRSIAPMLWVLVGLAGIELLVVHMLVAFWSHRVALLLSLLSAASIVWLVRAILSFRHRPVILASDRLLLRVGRFKSIDVPISAIAGLRPSWDGAAIKDRALLNLALVAFPNVVIDLCTSVAIGGPRRRMVGAVAHRLDDPEDFVAALRAALAQAARAD